MRKLVIMFTEIPEIEIRNIPEFVENEKVEEYIRNALNYNPDLLEWQIYDQEPKILINVVND